MSNLPDLADEFYDLVVLGEETYGPSEKADALITNLKQVYHQIKGVGFEKHNFALSKHITKALNNIAETINVMHEIKSDLEERAANEWQNPGPDTLKSAVRNG